MAPSMLFLIGIVPATFLVFGVYVMKRNHDFSSMDAAVKAFKVYALIVLIFCALGSVYFGFKVLTATRGYYYGEVFFIYLVSAAIAYGYIVAVDILFYDPLKKHSDWVAVNGIFSSRRKYAEAASGVHIIKGEKFRQYSVADELTKWAKLKEDGYISEDEFNEARAKLLRRQ